ncbi:bifunctional folylpolyglutamate synthase/dihydrofolate synthase [Candidatus Mycalebacterium sp.]
MNGLEYLRSLNQHSVKPGLERVTKILRTLGDPHLEIKTAVVAGTNGKTSTSSMLAEILFRAGFSTGLYTSPHLVRVGERIKTNGNDMEDGKLSELIERVHSICENENVRASYFEVLTVAAFIFFKEQGVDFAVLETGMGGRWDAVNIASPLVCAITNISMDHAQYLGNTEEKIAGEKAGIAKHGVPLITGARGGALAVIEKTCAEKKSPVLKNGEDFECAENNGGFSYSGRIWKIENITPAMKGPFQISNAAIALACAEIIASQGFDIPLKKAKEAIEKVRVGARMEYVRENPPFIIDGAHNTESARRLAEAIAKNHPHERFVFIVAMSDDKNHAEFLREIETVCSRLILTRSQSGRSVDAEKLLKFVSEGIEVETADSPEKALEKAEKTSLPLCVTGSLFFAGEVRELIL